MAFVVSNWRIRYILSDTSEFLIVDFGDEIDEEIELPWSQRVDTFRPLRGTGVKKYGRDQIETTLSIGVWKIHATHAAARNYILALAASVPKGESKDVRIDVLGGNVYRLRNAAIVAGTPKMMSAGGAIRTWVQYKLEGGEIS